MISFCSIILTKCVDEENVKPEKETREMHQTNKIISYQP